MRSGRCRRQRLGLKLPSKSRNRPHARVDETRKSKMLASKWEVDARRVVIRVGEVNGTSLRGAVEGG